MVIYEIRLINFRELLNQHGGPAKLAARLEMSASQLSQLIGVHPTRNIGSGLARRIEKKLNLLTGWLDQPHILKQADGEYLLGLPDIQGRSPLISWARAAAHCKSSAALADNVIDDWLPCPVIWKKEIFALVVRGDSMTDQSANDYRDGDLVFVDPTIRPAHDQDVIVQFPDGQMILRRYQELPEGRFLKALNPRFPDSILPLEEKSIICGVIVFSGKRRA